MRKYFVYLIVYSIGGFFLERIINFFAFMDDFSESENVVEYIIAHDNSIMIGPYQPLYGVGVVLGLIVWDLLLKKDKNVIRRNVLLLLVAIFATGLSEAVHGYGYEYFTGIILWDYRDFFPCQIPYVCIYPTTFFGIVSFMVIKYVHPLTKIMISLTPKLVLKLVSIIFVIDALYTLFFVLLD